METRRTGCWQLTSCRSKSRWRRRDSTWVRGRRLSFLSSKMSISGILTTDSRKRILSGRINLCSELRTSSLKSLSVQISSKRSGFRLSAALLTTTRGSRLRSAESSQQLTSTKRKCENKGKLSSAKRLNRQQRLCTDLKNTALNICNTTKMGSKGNSWNESKMLSFTTIPYSTRNSSSWISSNNS